MKKILSKIISFFLGKSITSTYRCSCEVSWETGWHASDIVSLYLNGKGRKYFFGWVIDTKKDKDECFSYSIEWWPQKDLLKKYFDFCERIFKILKYYIIE